MLPNRTRRSASRHRRSRHTPRLQRLESRALLALVITEIMYDPASDDDDWEWIEVTNDGGADIDLSGHVVDDDNETSHPASNVAGGIVRPGRSAVLYSSAISAADFTAAWGPGIQLIPVDGWSNMSLSNESDRIGIWSSFAAYQNDHTTHANTIEDVLYDDAMNWPTSDGAASIYLTDVALDNAEGANWALSRVGVAGATNSAYGSGGIGGDIGSPGRVPGAIPPGIAVLQSDGYTTAVEGGRVDTYEIMLHTMPSGPVEITVTADAQVEISVDGVDFAGRQTLSLTDMTPRAVTVRAAQDESVEGGHVGSVSHAITGQVVDAEYPADMSVAGVSVFLSDDDQALPELKFTEIMYNPDSEDDRWEWIEVYNSGIAAVDLAGFVVDDNNGEIHTSAGIKQGSIEPGSAAVLYNAALTPEEFRGAWGANVNAVPVDGWSVMDLGNDGDRIGLWSSLGQYLGDHLAHDRVIEGVEFSDDPPWPADDGAASIYLTNALKDSGEGTNWSLSSVGVDGARTGNPDPVSGSTGNDVGSPGHAPIAAIPPAVRIVAPNGRTVVDEDGASDTYLLRLDSVPSSPVELTLGTDGQLELSLDGVGYSSPLVLELHDTSPREVFVRAVNDDATEGLAQSLITHDVTASEDAGYPIGMAIDDLVVTVIDNDPPTTPLMITEIMYNPDSDDSLWEWVEVFNRGDVEIDLADYVLDDDNGTAHESPNIAGGIVPPRGLAVLYNGELVEQRFRDAWGGGLNLVPVSNWSAIRLSNGGERISLWDRMSLYAGDHERHDNAITGVEYDNGAPWPADDGEASIYRTEFSPLPGNLDDRAEAWSRSEVDVDGSRRSTAEDGPLGANTGFDVGSPGALPPPDTTPPTVMSIEINSLATDPEDLPSGAQPTSWIDQRSDLRSLRVTFSEPVVIGIEDLRLTNLGVNAPLTPDVPVALTADQLSLEDSALSITFAAGSLSDGVYRFEILADVVDRFDNPLDGNRDGAGGDDYVLVGDSANAFYKLTADFDGDLWSSALDLTTFVYWFGDSVPRAPEYVDLNGDSGISIFDFPALFDSYDTSIVFPPSPLAAHSPAATGDDSDGRAAADRCTWGCLEEDESSWWFWHRDGFGPGAESRAERLAAARDLALQQLLED